MIGNPHHGRGRRHGQPLRRCARRAQLPLALHPCAGGRAQVVVLENPVEEFVAELPPVGQAAGARRNHVVDLGRPDTGSLAIGDQLLGRPRVVSLPPNRLEPVELGIRRGALSRDEGQATTEGDQQDARRHGTTDLDAPHGKTPLPRGPARAPPVTSWTFPSDP